MYQKTKMFEGRDLLISTNHGKEQVIGPMLSASLGINFFTIPNLNTDDFGTFSGEVERIDDPFITTKKKCERGMELSNFDLALASEGSFGPHPTLLFVPADDELLVLVDKKNDLLITAREICTETNFAAKEIQSEAELLDFAVKHLFPSHAMILKSSTNGLLDVIKGITNKEELISGFNKLFSKYNSVTIETDMRAMYNPSRMKVIGNACKKLIDKIKSYCPQCNVPGFSVGETITGLPCKLCGAPTYSIQKHIYHCQKCNYRQILMHPFGKQYEDPMYCDICNP
jgi:hypothetical protein